MNCNRHHLDSVVVPAVSNPMLAAPVILLLGDGKTLGGGTNDPGSIIDHYHVSACLSDVSGNPVGEWSGIVEGPADMGNFQMDIQSITDPGQLYIFRATGFTAGNAQVSGIGTSGVGLTQ